MAVYKGHQARVKKDTSTIAKSERATLEIAQNVDEYYEIGTRHPVEVQVGRETIRGSLTKAWVDPYWYAVMKGLDGGDVLFYFNKEMTGNYVLAADITVDRMGLTIPSDGWVTTDIDFVAESWMYYPQAGTWEA